MPDEKPKFEDLEDDFDEDEEEDDSLEDEEVDEELDDEEADDEEIDEEDDEEEEFEDENARKTDVPRISAERAAAYHKTLDQLQSFFHEIKAITTKKHDSPINRFK